ncbi:signal transduction histidine kinase [Pseudomonas sp. JUb42]|jgi:signal transduction histidine kinase|uniref:sensor histidine kinase n=1 Tax=Pseudomonas sp. JUb42 TaxID=2940611 RepID=UPI002168C2D4|nr:ATP-binding protein [Pseudomonas sp. JUb42]MCS3472079.1 signal transduction histidine kinase [Pseudomonas sp. JUb42]
MGEKENYSRARGALRLSALLALAFGIAVVDTLTDMEIAVGVFHVAVVLLAMSFLSPKGVARIAVLCLILTVISFLATKSGDHGSGLINCLISLAAIIAATYLSLRMAMATRAEHEARAHLAQIGRVNMLGELTASIAHEVNQPLAAIATSGNACLRWLAGEPANLPKARQAVERIISDAHRASEVIARVRALAKRAPPHKEWLNVADTITGILALVHSELEQQRVQLNLQIPEGLPPLLADRVQVQQVLLNLILNASEAINAARDERRELEIRVDQQPSGQLGFAVCDTGIGLDTESAERLFEAFYTTKAEGMGIGLAVSRSIIEAHGGRIWASANPGGGAIFHFTLPGNAMEPT